jgi:hypothetical protein
MSRIAPADAAFADELPFHASSKAVQQPRLDCCFVRETGHVHLLEKAKPQRNLCLRLEFSERAKCNSQVMEVSLVAPFVPLGHVRRN